MNYYPFYVGDYGRDTAHLTLAEHGAYVLLLNHQYSTEKPIQRDLAALERLCRATTPEEKSAVASVVDQFFPECSGGRMNRRAERQIPEEQRRIAKARENGRLGGRPNKPSGIPSGLATETQRDTQRQSSPSPSPSPSPTPYPELPSSTPLKLKEEKLSRAKSSASAPDGDFLAFWESYPRKVGKAAALKVWGKLNGHSVPIDQMLKAVQQQKAWPQWQEDGGRFIPHPATWLNEGRWEDKPTEVAQDTQDWSSYDA